MSQAKVGQIICRAGRGTRCIHKRNARIMGGDVVVVTCAVDADSQLCSKAGQSIKAEVI